MMLLMQYLLSTVGKNLEEIDMVVTSNNYGIFTHLSGTIAEVAAELSAQAATTERVIFWVESGANARAVYFGRKR